MIIWTYCLAIILVLASVESKNGDIDKKKIEHGKGKSHISKQINKYLREAFNKKNHSPNALKQPKVFLNNVIFHFYVVGGSVTVMWSQWMSRSTEYFSSVFRYIIYIMVFCQ